MKALILTEGGKKIGFGHITRCEALRDALKLRRVSTTLVVFGDESVRKHFGGKIDRILNWMHPKRFKKLLRKFDIVIVDSYLAPLSLYQIVSKETRIPVFIDDFVRLQYPRGIVAAGAIGAEKFCYPQKVGCRYLLGIHYALLRREFWRIRPKKILPEIRNVLVTFGGIDRFEFIVRMLKRLSKNCPQWRFHVITAHCFQQAFQLQKISKKIKFHDGLNAAKMISLMRSCDVAISGGGQTSNELSRCGLPALGIRFAKNQMPNLLGWEKRGVLKYVGGWQDADLNSKITKELMALDFCKRQKMSRAGMRMVDGRGACRVVDAILKKLDKS